MKKHLFSILMAIALCLPMVGLAVGCNTTPAKATELVIEVEEFVQGQSFKSGATVTAKFDNGESQEVTDYTVEGYSANTVGMQTVTIKFDELVEEVQVNVLSPDNYVAMLNSKLLLKATDVEAYSMRMLSSSNVYETQKVISTNEGYYVKTTGEDDMEMWVMKSLTDPNKAITYVADNHTQTYTKSETVPMEPSIMYAAHLEPLSSTDKYSYTCTVNKSVITVTAQLKPGVSVEEGKPTTYTLEVDANTKLLKGLAHVDANQTSRTMAFSYTNIPAIPAIPQYNWTNL